MLRASHNAPAESSKGGVSTGWWVYGAGVAVLVGTLATGDILNPQARSGVSRFSDLFEGPLFVLSFVLCAVAPLWSSGRWLVRFGFVLVAILGYCAVLAISFVTSMLLTGMPMD